MAIIERYHQVELCIVYQLVSEYICDVREIDRDNRWYSHCTIEVRVTFDEALNLAVDPLQARVLEHLNEMLGFSVSFVDCTPYDVFGH